MMQRLAVDSPQLREIAARADLSQHARRNLDRFLSSAGTTSERYGAVLRSPEAVERALTIFEFSEFLTDILVRHPAEVSLLEEIEERAVADEPDIVLGDSVKLGKQPAIPCLPIWRRASRSLRGHVDFATALSQAGVSLGRR